LNSALKVLLGLDIYPRVPRKKFMLCNVIAQIPLTVTFFGNFTACSD